MYIYHKQCEIMQKKFNETAQTANLFHFLLIDFLWKLVVKTFSKAAAERLQLIKRQLRLTSD